MRKKLFLLMALAICLFGGVLFLKEFFRSSLETCAFCDPRVLDRQKFYEDELVIAMCTHKPVFPGHCLIIPKRHVERFEMLTDEEITQMGRVIKRVDQAVMKMFGTSSYLLLQKNGLEVGQSVPHVHFHYIPRKAGDDSAIQFIFKMYLANIKPPISQDEMAENVGELRQAMR